MKVEQGQASFQPVTVTLETIQEVNYLASLIGGSDRATDEKFGLRYEDALAIFSKLDDLAEDFRPRLTVRVHD